MKRSTSDWLQPTVAGMKEILDLATARDHCEEEAIQIIKRSDTDSVPS